MFMAVFILPEHMEAAIVLKVLKRMSKNNFDS